MGKKGYGWIYGRKKWDKKTRKTHDKLDIDKYLAEEARRFILDQQTINEYKEVHKTRDRAKSYFGVHRHGSNPICKICDEFLVVGDDVFHFYVSGSIMYHVTCFIDERESTQRNIIYQDRAWRKKNL